MIIILPRLFQNCITITTWQIPARSWNMSCIQWVNVVCLEIGLSVWCLDCRVSNNAGVCYFQVWVCPFSCMLQSMPIVMYEDIYIYLTCPPPHPPLHCLTNSHLRLCFWWVVQLYLLRFLYDPVISIKNSHFVEPALSTQCFNFASLMKDACYTD